MREEIDKQTWNKVIAVSWTFVIPNTGCTQMIYGHDGLSSSRQPLSEPGGHNTQAYRGTAKLTPTPHIPQGYPDFSLISPIPWLLKAPLILVPLSVLDWFHIRVDSIVVSESATVVEGYLGQLVKFLMEKENVSLPLLLIHLPVLGRFTYSQLKVVVSSWILERLFFYF